ncbi:MAG: HD domain-containing phosphohydrolase [Actinomycetota bacterium]
MSTLVGTEGMGRTARLCLAGLTGLLVVAVFHALTDLSFGPLEAFISKWSYNVVLIGSSLACVARGVLVPEGRKAWTLLGGSMVLWSIGNIYYSVALWDMSVIPVPSISDGFWIVFYPLSLVAVAALVRARTSGLHLWLDGTMGALAAGAIVAAIVFDPLFEVASGNALALATNFAYPVGDLLLISLVVGAIGVSGWRLDGPWVWLGGGLVLFAVIDSIYLVQVANETWVPGNVLEAGWPAAMLCVGFAAWHPHRKLSLIDQYGTRIATMPLLFASLALSLVIWDHFDRVNIISLTMASAALAIAITRMTIVFRQNVRMLDSSVREAMTDSLTGLGNRRCLMRDLEDACAKASDEEPLAVVILDLNGFKPYNDTFGHLAGDALLARLGHSLEMAIVGGRAYRLGGDEFCVLVSCRNDSAEAITSRLVPALSDQGEGFTIGAAAGWSVIPTEETTPSGALRHADRRMYENKNSGRVSEGRLAGNVLLQVLQERDPELQLHQTGVAALAEKLCNRLDIPEVEAHLVRLAAELHDVGKVAVPDEVLNKPGPLNEDEMAFIKQHTIIGQRILGVSPALNFVAQLVRSSHEAVDGSGYPDGLSGEDIPLGARIVAVCDAFDAMVSDRPYRGAMSVEEAVAELKRCAGTQFDAEVVGAFISDIRAQERHRTGVLNHR